MGLNQIKKLVVGTDDKIEKIQDDAGFQFEKVSMFQDAGMKKLFMVMIVLCASSMSTGWDGMYMGVVQNFDSWNDFFGKPQGSDLGLLVAFYQIGAVISIPIVPFIADKWGRKPSIGTGFIIMAGGAAMQAAAPNLAVYSAGRVLLGFGNSFAQIASPMLLAEVAHPQYRARFTTIYNCLWNLGSLLVSWTCYGTHFWGNDWEWRFPALIQGVPGLIQLVFLFWIPESPRWLIAHDRDDEALAVLTKYHANGNVDHPTVQFEFHEIRDTIKMEKIADTSTKYIDFFKTKGNRYRLCVLVALGLFSQWSGNGVVSNYSARLYKNAGMQKEDDRLILSAGKTILDIIISTGCALLSERVNRRFTFLFSTGGMLIALLFWTLTCGLHEQHQAAGANAGMIFLVWMHGVFYSCCWSGLLVGYAVEILPYSIRAKGLMFLNMSIQVSLLLNTYLNPLAFEAWEIPEGEVGHETGYGGTTWYLYLIYTIWVAGEVVFIYFMFVETRGPTLEELVRVIDGEDAQLSALDLGVVEKESVEDDAHHRTSSSEKVRRVNVSAA